MELLQGQYKISGVVLYRKDISSSRRSLYIWGRERGPLWAFAGSSSRGKVRWGETEPLTWGVFHLHKSPKGFSLRGVDAKPPSWSAGASPWALGEALRWTGLLKRSLLQGHPEDELLRTFYWSLSSLREESRERLLPWRWRFYWKWLRLWGLAPDLWHCGGCGKPLGDSGACCSSESPGFFCSSCGRARKNPREIAFVLQELRKAVMLSRSAFSRESFSLAPQQWEVRIEDLERILSERE